MKNQVFKLLMLQINAKYGKAQSANAAKYIWMILRYLLIMGVATVVFFSAMTWFVQLGMLSNIFLLSIALLVTQTVATAFAVSSILSNLFFNKDNELLLVLPVSANQVFVSKLLMVYFSELLVNTMFSFPVLATIGFFANLNWVFFVILPLSMLVLPLVPLGLGTLLSVPISLFVSFLKKHNYISIVFILLLVSVLLFLYINFMQGINSSFNFAADQIKVILGINITIREFGMSNRPYLDIAHALTSFKLSWILLLYTVAGIAFVALSVIVVKPIYFRSIMKNTETSQRQVKAKGVFKQQSSFWSLISKEFKDIFRSPNYVFQYFLFTLLMPIIVFCYDRLLLQLVVNSVGKGMIAGSHVLIVAIIAMLSNLMSASSVSREGANFYLIKTTPVSFFVQTFAKLTFNAMFTVGAIVLTGIVSSFYLDVAEVWLGSIAIIFASLAHICLSFDFDLSSPTLDWYDDSDITKMSKNTARSLAVGMVIAVAIGAIVISSAKKPMQGMALCLIAAIVLLAYSLFVLLVRIYYRYGETEV